MNAKRGVWLARGLLLLAVAAVLAPVLYQIGLSLKPASQIFGAPLSPFSWPATLENYRVVLEKLPFGRYLFNTLAFALGVTFGQIVLAVLAAYAFSAYRFRGQGFLFGWVLVSLMIPFVVTYLPNYLLLARLKLLNTLPGLILPMLAGGYGIFLMRQHFRSFPRSILEAAQVDGASSWQILWRVLVPANLAAISALAVYVFINTWNQFVWPLLVANQPQVYVLTVAVQRFAGGEGVNNWGAMMAAATLATLPTLLLYLAMRRAILETFAEGAVKG
ncbi:MAG: carbohydrate ABC transporter permease [Meiothermus silvanus]|nr:carbohydrate ABC transporter permease [Allomeiothermus silvanus]